MYYKIEYKHCDKCKYYDKKNYCNLKKDFTNWCWICESYINKDIKEEQKKMVNIYSISWMEDGDRLYKAFYNIDERSNYREGLINRGIDIYSIIEKNNKIQAR